MQELRLVMIVIGAVAIVALLIHGLWASRKERPEKFGERPIQKVMEKDTDGFDPDGVGAVRVVRSAPAPQQGSAGFSQDPLFFGDESEQKSTQKKASEKRTSEKKIAKNQPIHSKMKTVKDFYHFEDTEEDIALAEEEQALLRGQNEQRSESEVEQNQPTQSQPEPEQQVLIFNVQAQVSKPFKGEELVSGLEQYGMHFGEMNIFHRHVENTGAGKILFSAANMLQPGSFNISTLHQFTTPGVTFFMTLPCYGEAEQNFKLMLKTAQQVADLLGGHVTDDHRNLLTPKRLDEYREKVKRFVAVT